MDRLEDSIYDYNRSARLQKSTVLVIKKIENEARERLAVSAFSLDRPHVPADCFQEDQTKHL